MKVIVASDYRGYWVRKMAVEWLSHQGFEVIEFGGDDGVTRDNYVCMADDAMHAFQKEGADRAVLVCGSGIGICMRANRYPFARAFVAQHRQTPRQAREHNNANVMCFSGETTTYAALEADLKTFFNTSFEAEKRADRIEALSAPIKEGK